MSRGRRRGGARAVLVAGVALAGCVAAAGWWAFASARVPPLPPPPPDEGAETTLRVEYLGALAELRPQHWQARVALAGRLMERGDARGAAVRLREARTLRPRDTGILRAQAYAAAAAGYLDEQVSAWNELARIRPDDLESRVRLADLYRQLGWYGLAAAAAAEAVRLGPANPEALRVGAIVAYVMDDYRQATALAERLIAVAPDRPVAYSVLASCHRAAGRWAQAEQAAAAALARAPAEAGYVTSLARIHLDRTDRPAPEQALAVLEAFQPQDDAGRLSRTYWRGVALLRLGRAEEGRAELEAVAARNPQFEQVAFELARAYQAAGDGATAARWSARYEEQLRGRSSVRDAEAALRRDLTSPELHVQLGRAALAAGDAPRAVFEARAALHLARNRPEPAAAARALLNEALRAAGREEEAAR
jgi:tetratricopeptide (TPR) repeat protein